jgi:hypothetical protein
MQATMAGRPVWTAIDLRDIRTSVLASLDLRHAPAPAVSAVRAELAARRSESRAS